jgi:hypothetical protein
MMSFGGQASCTKMTSPGGKLIAMACHPTKKVMKAEELPISLKTLFDGGLTSAEGQKLGCFKWAANNIFISSMKI